MTCLCCSLSYTLKYRMRIVDDDVSWNSISAAQEKEEEAEDEGDLPVVAEFIDERPEEVKRMEEFRTNSKWKLLGDQNEDSQSSDLSLAAKSTASSETTKQKKIKHLSEPSPPRRGRHDSPEISPPRRQRHDSSDESLSRNQRRDSPDLSPPRRGRRDSPDLSPPRRGRRDSPDLSPPRRGRRDSPDLSPPRRGRRDSPDLSPPRRGRRDSPDLSPPRRGRRDSPDLSPPRRGRRDSPDLSPPRRGRRDSPDLSPPRRGRRDSPGLSPPRRGRRDSPDLSPPRRGRRDSPDHHDSVSGKKNKKTMDKSLPGGIQGERSNLRSGFPHKSSSHHKRQITPDLSPLRKNRDSSDLATSPSWRKRTGSPSGLKKQSSTRGFSPANKKPKQALSPKRRKRHDSDSSLARKSSQDSSDSDLSPLRNSHRPGLLHRDSPSKLSPPTRNQNTSSDSDLSPPRRSQAAGKKLHGSKSSPGLLPPRRGPDSKRSFQGERGEDQRASQMLSGGKAGLVSADLLRREQQELRRHDRNNKHLEDESQNAETVFRDKSGRKRDLMQERLEQQKKAEAKSERDELYAKWGKGLAQGRQQQQNVEDAVKEMQKPLARYIDDQDLDQMLREKEREGDPMANFIRKKKAKESKDKKEKPRYNGPAPPLNRFNLWPGYRWDGVDRSNGFEQKRFARLASKKAVQELAYKWSVEDM
ncbi:BUD13 homolog isoform X4 [Chrysemys picta bellii]|uniref:BUD13 homolog isoform X3 n=1 Tax=Chrysemys picta bellii TaxID=8478 RepID=UPI0032B253F3